VLPVGIDLLFAGTTDGTANVGNEQGNPVKKALNDLDGISTLAPIDVQCNNPIDTASVNVSGSPQNVYLVRLPNAADAATLTLPTGVEASDINALDLSTIGNFFSPLKPDGTAPASAAETVAGLNLASIIGAQPVVDQDYEVSVISLDGVENNTIRINPIEPLDSKTKYVVIVTGSVKDPSGQKVSASPDYASISGTGDLVSSALSAVRTLLDTLEALGGQIITSGGSNLAPLADGIVFSAPFTTTDPDTVLKSMAYPGFWAQSAVANNDPVVATTLIATAEGAGLAPTGTGATLIATAEGVGLSTDEATIFAAGYMLSGALTEVSGLSATVPYESPREREFELI
jgi:hypothetical protein